MREKYLESLQVNISNIYWKNRKHHLHLLFLLYSNAHNNTACKCLFKIPLRHESVSVTF